MALAHQLPHMPLEAAHCAHIATHPQARSLLFSPTPTNRMAGDFKHSEKHFDLWAECLLLVISVLSYLAHAPQADQFLPSEVARLTQHTRKHLKWKPVPTGTCGGGVLWGACIPKEPSGPWHGLCGNIGLAGPENSSSRWR